MKNSRMRKQSAVSSPWSTRRGIGLLIFAGVVLSVCAPANRALAREHEIAHLHWSYAGPGGPSHWGDLEPGFALCKEGQRQSPIDIRSARREILPPIHFDYKPMPLKIINNGHSIQINAEGGGGMWIGGKRYALLQFHFHRPSEEEVGGKRFDMAAHLVHRDAAGHLAVVAILFEAGKDNPFIQALWNHLPPDQGKECAPRNVTVNAAGLLPANQNYYTFAGSLTTPPCTEGVTWYVLRSPVEISAAQIAVFSRLYPDNARPIQPGNGRVILESSLPK